MQRPRPRTLFVVTIVLLGSAGCAHTVRPKPDSGLASGPLPEPDTRSEPVTGWYLDDSATLVEREVEAWSEPASHYGAPRALAPEYSPIGRWIRQGVLRRATLTIEPPVDGIYPVEFQTSGCLDRWTLRRAATYSRGVLVLDRPVQEYTSQTYKRLYLVRVAGEAALMPAPRAAEFAQRDPAEIEAYGLYLTRDWMDPRPPNGE